MEGSRCQNFKTRITKLFEFTRLRWSNGWGSQFKEENIWWCPDAAHLPSIFLFLSATKPIVYLSENKYSSFEEYRRKKNHHLYNIDKMAARVCLWSDSIVNNNLITEKRTRQRDRKKIHSEYYKLVNAKSERAKTRAGERKFMNNR